MPARSCRNTKQVRTIRKYVKLDLTINRQTRPEDLLVTGLGKQRIILGFPWFKTENPDIDWTKGTLTWRNSKQDTRNNPKPFMEEEDDEEEWKTQTLNPIDHDGNNILISYLEEMKEEELWINAKMNVAMELAIKENERNRMLQQKNQSLKTFMIFWMYLMKNRQDDSLNRNLGIIRLK